LDALTVNDPTPHSVTPALAITDAPATPLTPIAAPRPDAAAFALPHHGDELGAGALRLLTGGVLAAHLVGGWALLQIDSVRQAVVDAAPIMVSLIAPPEKKAPPPPPPAPVVPQPKKMPAPTPVPLIAAAPTPDAAPSSFVALPPPPVAQPVVVAAAPEQPAAPPAPAPAPAPLKQVPPGAVRYLTEPRMSVPLLSKRLGESGTVVLRIVVDVRGHLKHATVRKSSGFERLDKQALLEIRTARFVPQTENGQPVEWETLAPMAYELE